MRKRRSKKKSSNKEWKPEIDDVSIPRQYHEKLHTAMMTHDPHTLPELNAIMVEASEKSSCHVEDHLRKPWQSEKVQQLILKRRHTQDKQERKNLSKQIFKITH